MWEYKRIVIDYETKDETLNYYGTHGWELVSVVQLAQISFLYAYFKRPK